MQRKLLVCLVLFFHQVVLLSSLDMVGVVLLCVEMLDDVEGFFPTVLAQQPSRREWDESTTSEDDKWRNALECQWESPVTDQLTYRNDERQVKIRTKLQKR
jgi:hypothetical protein